MDFPKKIDLHMHSAVSDGTDRPTDLIGRVKEAGIELFSLTDHDAVRGCVEIQAALEPDDPAFLTGVEFSCGDEEGQYHILGYGYDPQAASILDVVEAGHALRMSKLQNRLDFLEREFGFRFSEEDRAELFALYNPGKPHIGSLMARYGYAADKNEAIKNYLNRLHEAEAHVRPETAIQGILGAGGIPVLAHPSYGRGDEIIVGDNMDRRLRKLIDFGLRGVEAFYSGFTPKLQEETLSFAQRYDLFITAGSDYHGSNKTVRLGDTNLTEETEYPAGLRRFLDAVL